MSFTPRIEKTLKVKTYGFPRPTNVSSYVLGTSFIFETNSRVYYSGNLTGTSLTTHTNTNDTIILPKGRYFVQASVPVGEPAYSGATGMNSLAYIEWQNFQSSSLNGTYSSFGIKGRSNPGDKPSDTGDDAGVHSYSSGIVESSNDIYLQVRVVTNSNYTVLQTTTWSYPDAIIIWRAD